jgi:hypothetical protein
MSGNRPWVIACTAFAVALLHVCAKERQRKRKRDELQPVNRSANNGTRIGAAGDNNPPRAPGSAKWNVGFRHKETTLLGFELKVTKNADIYMLVFERGHRRMHISYHRDGRFHYKADRPNADSVPIMRDYPTGIMTPVGGLRVCPLNVVDRQEVGITGWGMADVERAGLSQFTPGAEDILIVQPQALSLGFCVNVVGPRASPRAARGGDRIIERRYVQGVVTLEIEIFDWLAE